MWWLREDHHQLTAFLDFRRIRDHPGIQKSGAILGYKGVRGHPGIQKSYGPGWASE